MKHVILSTIISYVLLLSAPQNQRDVAVLALRAALFFAELGVILHPADDWYDAGRDDEHERREDAALGA